VSFLGLLALLFIGLKLGGVIAWSWWLVLLPVYLVPVGMLLIAATAYASHLVLKAGR
jgi:hypothetical protein